MNIIHPSLAKECYAIGRLPLSDVLLMNDSQFPWCILVPGRENISEIYQLSDIDQQQLIRESSCLGEAMMQVFGGDKLNIGALGNIVPQLHIHHIVRFVNDAAWPGPVWGKVAAIPYTSKKQRETAGLIHACMQGHIEFIDCYLK